MGKLHFFIFVKIIFIFYKVFVIITLPIWELGDKKMKLTKLQEYILDDYLGCGTPEECEISADIIEELKNFDSVNPKLLKK